MQGGKNWILPKEINANRFFSETLIGWKSGKTAMSLYGTEWRERMGKKSGSFKIK